MHNDWASFINAKVSGANATVNTPENAETHDASITVNAEHLHAVCEALKNGEHEMNVLQVVSGVDWPEENQIEVCYMLASFIKNTELILKVRLPRDNPKVGSLCDLWKAANFLERETYDMFGVDFEGHPDQRRILTSNDWEGWPLRKDYVVAETYKGMVVNPEHKLNLGEREFGARHKHIKGANTSVDNYEVEAPAGSGE